MTDPNMIKRDKDDNILMRSFCAKLEVMKLTGEKLQEEFRMKTAETLLSAGLILIPSDHLNDNEFVISRGIYEAAKKITKID